MPDPNPRRPYSSQTLGDKLDELLLQADTFARTASNVATGGFADRAEAAWGALFDRSPGDWRAHYKAALQNQLARDYYDASHRQIATALGDAAGVGLLTYGSFGLGADASAALPIRAKGQLGEGLSAAKTVLHGDWPVGFQVRKTMQNGRTTVLDHETARGMYVESKFGPSAKLTPNQRYAQQQWGPEGYRVDYWMPYHVGAMAAPAGALGGLLSWGMQQPNAPEQDDHERSSEN